MLDKTLHKGLALLEILSAKRELTGIAELARETGWGRSNVHRILQTLEATGYVRNVGGRYEASLKLWELGCRILDGVDLKRVAQAQMRELADATKETVHLSILNDVEVVYLDKIESSQPVRAYTAVGGRAPASCVATGKALIAFADADLLRRIEARLVRYTSSTITEVAAMRKEIGGIRRFGYAVNRGEWREQVWGVAAPIRNVAGEVVAAIGVSGPESRFTKASLEDFKRLVCEAANAISVDLGYRPDNVVPVASARVPKDWQPRTRAQRVFRIPVRQRPASSR
jgi:IclR family transcriptional regulator, KDG regulon repressor